MVDSDPISDTTPNKRRKLADDASHGRAWDSQEDDDAEFTIDNFVTQPTLPLASQKRKLGYPQEQYERDLSHLGASSSMMLPTQRMETLGHVTQPTMPLPQQRSIANSSDVLVDRSSPPQLKSSPPVVKPLPMPMQRAPFAKPLYKPYTGLLASLGPAGTTFRAPLGVQARPPPTDLTLDSDEESDPPVHHSDDGETQGLRSNIKPTNFKKGGRGLDSTPNRSEKVAESPHARNAAPLSSTTSVFGKLIQDFKFNSRKPADDSVSAYGNSSRSARSQAPAPRANAVADAVPYKTLDNVPDHTLRRKIQEIQDILPAESVQRCYQALSLCKGKVEAAMSWLADTEDRPLAPTSDDRQDELASLSPVVRRGVASTVSQGHSSQPLRPAAKQGVQAPSKSIAEKYARKVTQPTQPTQPVVVELSEDDEGNDLPKRRRLQRGRKPRDLSPPSSPPVHKVVKRQQATAIDSEDESDSGVGRDESEEAAEPANEAFEKRLLKFMNECTPKEMAELCAQPDDVISTVLSQRPFSSLDAVRAVSYVPEKRTGKKSKPRLVGAKLVEIASDMWSGYEAVDELVEQCENIARPIQEALRGWGVGAASDGELQLMNLGEAHDSGIGTPTSSCPSDDLPAPRVAKEKKKSTFLAQPENMGDLPLKDYQLVGLNWLNLLWSKRISCILADDMGLGKTCQVIAFLSHLKMQEMEGLHLVIVPVSTIENWLREFERFAPRLNVRPYTGSQSERQGLQEEIRLDRATIDVIVTTYSMAESADDNYFLRKMRPCVCIYDEAHILRNPVTRRYQSLMRIPAEFKIMLTGTPLQNNLQELVAVLAFIMPRVFAEKREQLDYIFKAKATTKSADNAALLSGERIARARTMITPFVLRRKKAQVLDLPTKHSRVEYCDMTPSQAAYYQGLVAQAQQLLVGNPDSKAQVAKAKSNMLMALRQAAIHPLLARRIYNEKKMEKIQAAMTGKDEWVGNTPELIRRYLSAEGDGAGGKKIDGGDWGVHLFCVDPVRASYLQKFALKKKEWMDSGKVRKFQQLMEQFVSNGDRVLVFSQFTALMNILEAVLETMDIRFVRLDGSTKTVDRQPIIDLFTADESIPVFMLSTRAGGAGINLASANKVIIFDSGFNPQDDVQAENRAHRVGQTREVEVIRLVTRGTIEEQIHALGESKLALDAGVSGAGGAATAVVAIGEDKAAEARGEMLVQEMLAQSLAGDVGKKEAKEGEADTGDLRDAFKMGLQRQGVSVRSKQARF